MRDTLTPATTVAATLGACTDLVERGHVRGTYALDCTNQHGELLWTREFDNVVTTVGQNQLLSDGLTTTAYLMLISSASYTAVAVTDTMASHSGWLEADGSNAPSYSGNRPAATFGTPSGGAASITPASFTMTGAGTIEGIAIVFGTGASATPGNTGGVLLSAGALATAQPVISGNTVTASYTLSL